MNLLTHTKRICILSLLLPVLFGLLSADALAQQPSPEIPQSAGTEIVDPTPANWPYPWRVGEEIEYKIVYGALNVGKVRCSTDWIKTNGWDLIRIQVKVKSNKLISSVYPIEGTLESLVDPITFRPIQSTRKMREGKRRSNELNVFDRPAQTGRWQSFTKNKKKEFKIGPDTLDVLSFMYDLRGAPLTVGTTTKKQVMSDEKVYDLELKFEKKERLKVEKVGKIDCVKVRPTATFNGLVSLKDKGDITAWVSDDARKICTKIVAETPFANLKIVLTDVDGPGTDKWVK